MGEFFRPIALTSLRQIGGGCVFAALVAMAFVACAGTQSSPSPTTTRPAWVDNGSTSQFPDSQYLTGFSSADASGDAAADQRTARKRALADLSSKLVAEVTSVFVTRLREHGSAGSTEVELDTLSRIEVRTRSEIPAEQRSLTWFDRERGLHFVLVAVSRFDMANAIQSKLEARDAEIKKLLAVVGTCSEEQRLFDGVRAINQISKALDESEILESQYLALGGKSDGKPAAALKKLGEAYDHLQASAGVQVLNVTSEFFTAEIRAALERLGIDAAYEHSKTHDAFLNYEESLVRDTNGFISCDLTGVFLVRHNISSRTEFELHFPGSDASPVRGVSSAQGSRGADEARAKARSVLVALIDSELQKACSGE